jgi:hypothetical protein
MLTRDHEVPFRFVCSDGDFATVRAGCSLEHNKTSCEALACAKGVATELVTYQTLIMLRRVPADNAGPDRVGRILLAVFACVQTGSVCLADVRVGCQAR